MKEKAAPAATSLDSRLDLLLSLVESITTSPDLDEVVASAVRAATGLVPGSLSTFWMLRDGRLVAWKRAGPREDLPTTAREEFALGEGMVGHAALERRIVLVPDLRSDPRSVDHTFFAAAGVTAAVMIPLISHDRFVGILSLLARRAEDLGLAELQMLQAFGAHAAIAIESAQLYAESQRRGRESRTLADVAHDLAECRDLATVLERIARGAQDLCCADVTGFALREPDGSFPARHVLGARTEAYRHFRVVPGLGIGGRAVLTGQPARAAARHEWPAMPADYAEPIDGEGIRSAIAMPIIVGKQIEGLLYVCSRSPQKFNDNDETVLMRLADHAATALYNNSLFAAEQTARTEAQAAAQDFRDLVDTIDAIVLDVDAETSQVHFVNYRAETILGYSRDAWYADPDFWAHHIHPDDRESARALGTEAAADGRDHVLQYRMVTADGRVRWMHDTIRVLPSGTDGRPRLRSVIVDITARKEAELEAAQQRQILTHMARVATLGELSVALAHELSQPLTAILSNAQAAQLFLAREPVDLQELRETLKDIVDDDRRAGAVIRRWRTLLQRGEAVILPLDLNEVARDVLRLAHSELIAHAVTVTTRLSDRLPIVRGDRVGLQQVLLNLIVNACDAMKNNSPAQRHLAIITEPEATTGVRIAITDQGPGIPADRIDRIFEPFFTTKEQGLGLGLAICRSIVTTHGGRLAVANNAGGGATFDCILPGQPDAVPAAGARL